MTVRKARLGRQRNRQPRGNPKRANPAQAGTELDPPSVEKVVRRTGGSARSTRRPRYDLGAQSRAASSEKTTSAGETARRGAGTHRSTGPTPLQRGACSKRRVSRRY